MSNIYPVNLIQELNDFLSEWDLKVEWTENEWYIYEVLKDGNRRLIEVAPNTAKAYRAALELVVEAVFWIANQEGDE